MHCIGDQPLVSVLFVAVLITQFFLKTFYYLLFITSALFNDYVLYLIALSITTLVTMFRGFNDVSRWQLCLVDSGWSMDALNPALVRTLSQ